MAKPKPKTKLNQQTARKKEATHKESVSEVAFYYPGPVWHHGDWRKNLILFFDGVALLVPAYMKNKPDIVDPAIAAGLRKEGLLHILEPEKLIDKSATKQLAAAMTEIINSGALDRLTKGKNTIFHELSYSRLGSHGDPGLAEAILNQLKTRGLARDTEDGVSIPMHPLVRGLVLVLLAQILRSCGNRLGFELSPATDNHKMIDALQDLLSLPSLPSSGHVVSLDLETVGVDLGAVPIDEILGFRKQHYKEHRAYVRAVRRFAQAISLLSEQERIVALRDRQTELRNLAADLKNLSRKAWKRPAYFGLTIAGSAVAWETAGPLEAILTASLALLGAPPREDKEKAAAYSYLFRSANRYPLL